MNEPPNAPTPPESIDPRSDFAGWLSQLPPLATRYEANRLLAFPMGPNTAQLLWDYADMVLDAIMERVPPPVTGVARLYNVTGRTNLEGALSWDIEMDPRARKAAIEIDQPGSEFIAALGYVDTFNRFHEIGQSNRFRMPWGEPDREVGRRGVSLDLQQSIAALRQEGVLATVDLLKKGLPIAKLPGEALAVPSSAVAARKEILADAFWDTGQPHSSHAMKEGERQERHPTRWRRLLRPCAPEAPLPNTGHDEGSR